jgi:minor extracellular serine protease Vpr
MRKFRSVFLATLLAAAALPAQAVPATAASPRTVIDVSALRVPAAERTREKYVARKDRTMTVFARLEGDSVASFAGNGFKQAQRAGAAVVSREAQQAQNRQIAAQQTRFVALAAPLGAREIARVSRAANGVILTVKASDVVKLAALPGVLSVRPVVNYSMDLAETVPYIGAKATQDSGVTGAGVTVAVLDSGIDYTHRNLGGAGTLAAYELAYGVATTDTRNTTRDGLFPTAKVIDGFDFVGETWGVVDGEEIGERTEDPDPIDIEGHGTSVADIVAGASADGAHKGVAPGAKLLAVKVCSAVTPACNGVALIKAVDYSLDPNGDGDISDAVDVMNLSLGSDYGQVEDDLSYALGQASQLGVVVVAAAGNAADRPYIVGSPSSQPEVISVAQTSVPGALTFPLVVNINGAASTIRNTNTLPWAPIGTGFSGPVVFLGRGCYGVETDDTSGAAVDDPYPAGVVITGAVALVNRGACSISAKIDRAARAGAIGVLVANNAGGDPPSFSQGFGTQVVPTVILTQNDGRTLANALAAGSAVTATVSQAVSIALVGSMVASSSRGPSYSYQAIKPEIGAPGASISAIAGSGSLEAPFGGTSGASPVVAGSAALVLSARPGLSPRDVKALLVNTADANITTNPATAPGVLAPVTRIGGGEVRVNRAVNANTAAWSIDDQNPALSFGYHAITEDKTLRKRIMVRNYSNSRRTYSITPTFRYANDAASGAVTPSAPMTLSVPANSSRSFRLDLSITASALPTWTLNGGLLGGTGATLQSVEFDGYLVISDSLETVHLPWHVLPRKAAEVSVSDRRVKLNKDGEGSTTVNSKGARSARVEVFSLTGVSPKLDASINPSIPGSNYTLIDLKAIGIRPVAFAEDDFGIQFGIATNGVRSHPLTPAEYDISIDTDRDGDYEFVIFNAGSATNGQCLVYVADLTLGEVFPVFFCDADLNSGNMIMTVGLADIGLTSLEQEFSYEITVYDNYFSLNASDTIWYMTTRPLTPRYFGLLETGLPIAPGSSDTLLIGESTTGWTEPTQANGILLLNRDAAPGRESEIISVR